MIRAHVDDDGKLVLLEGQSLDAVRNKDVFVLVVSEAFLASAPEKAGQVDPLLTRQGIYRQFTGEFQDQSLRFDNGVLVFDAGAAAETVDAAAIEQFIEQGREERLRFLQ